MKARLFAKKIIGRFEMENSFFVLTNVIAIALFVSLIACSKEKKEDLCSDPNLMREIRMQNVATQGLTYNSNCLVTELLEPYKYSKLSYNSSGQLTKVEEAVSVNPLSCVAIPGGDGGSSGDPRKAKVTSYYDYEYNEAGKLSKRLYFNLNNNVPQLSLSESFHYSDNVVDTIKVYSQNLQLNYFKTYVYENENLIVENFYLIEENNIRLLNRIEYEFDEMNNPYLVLAIMGTPGKYSNMNNIIKETYISNPGVSENKYSNSYSYEYNGLGNPVKINGNEVVYK